MTNDQTPMVRVLLGVDKPLARYVFSRPDTEDNENQFLQCFFRFGVRYFFSSDSTFLIFPFGDYDRILDVF